ncbi:MAG: arylesterase [Dongiaceae bacterium]
MGYGTGSAHFNEGAGPFAAIQRSVGAVLLTPFLVFALALASYPSIAFGQESGDQETEVQEPGTPESESVDDLIPETELGEPADIDELIPEMEPRDEAEIEALIPETEPREQTDVDALIPETGASSADAAPSGEIRILAFGASIVEGFGLAATESLPVRLEAALEAQGYDVAIVNAGVSGDTTAAGRARLGWTLAEPYDLAILALGSNDALRAIEPAETRANLDAMLTLLAEYGLPVLLVGMYAPRNLGADYVAEFDALYAELAEQHQVALMPFLLEGVALQPELNQSDGIHPNAAGVDVIVETMLPYLLPLVDLAIVARNAAEAPTDTSPTQESSSTAGPAEFRDEPPEPGTDRGSNSSGEPADGGSNP